MATEHHPLNRYHREQQQQQRSRDASSSRECLVQSLNNRACVLIAMGNFPRANHFLEIALQKHKERTQEALAPNKIHENNENSNYRSSSYDYNAMVSMHEYDSDDSDSDLDDEEDFCCSDENDNDFGYGNSYGYDHEFSRHNTSPKNVSLDRHHLQHQHQHQHQHHPQHMNINNNASANRPVLSKMISTPIRTFCYAGQRERRSPDQWMHHKVYALPIVMTPNEWHDAPLQDRSFVLIFNSAICNHLWGLELLRNHPQQQPAAAFQRSFSTARMLYRLALENVSSSHRGNPKTNQGIHGVDRLVYSAVFNNLSHLCKSLDGYQSEDAYRYDTFLLKSIYWYIDSSSSNQNQNRNDQQQHSNDEAGVCDEGDAEIMDSFLENVFYLIGVPPQVLPAAVA